MGTALRRIQVGNALSAFGFGFTFPYTFLYVSQGRDLGSTTAGLAVAGFAVAALCVLPFTGRIIDQRGPRLVALAGAVTASAGAIALGLAVNAPFVITATLLMGAGLAVIQPALATMIVLCSTTATRSRAFATQFFLVNLTIGLGGLLGGLIVDEEDAASFLVLYGIEAVMFLALAGVVTTVRLPAVAPERMGAAEDSPAGQGPSPGRWRALFADRSMVTLCALGFVMFFTCYGQIEAGLAAFALNVSGIAPATLGVALAANAAVIVLAQYVMLRLVERRRRSRVIAVVGLIWAVAWLVAGSSGWVAEGQALATAAIISTYALFGVGESMLSPTLAPLVADLAPKRLIGQYNSVFALVKQLALAFGAAFGGLLAGMGAYGVYIGVLVACALGISVLALRLGRRLTPAQDRPGAAEPEAGRQATARPAALPGADSLLP